MSSSTNTVGRQQSVYQSNVAYNMGLPNDPRKRIVWVDTYGAEFSRDIEPTIEGEVGMGSNGRMYSDV